MDYTYLMELAKSNEEQKKDEKFMVTKISKAKKLDRPAPNSSAIKNFLSKTEEKKHKEAVEREKERKAFLAKQAENKHVKKRENSMLKRTKGASKAVLDDAKDLITENGEDCIAADDFGYESGLSQQIFAKLCTQYKSTPEDERLKFNKAPRQDMGDIKARVKERLRKEEEEKLGIRKRQRKRKKKEEEFDDFFNDEDPYKKFKESDSKPKSSNSENFARPYNVPDEKSHKKEEKKVIKKKKAAPPPMSYLDLLNMAKNKRPEPEPLPIYLEEKTKEKEFEFERPLTAKEKAEKEEERLRKLRRSGKLPKLNASNSSSEKESIKDKKSSKSEEAKSSSVANNKLKNDLPKVANKGSVPDVNPQKKLVDKSKYFAVPGSSSIRKNEPQARKNSPPIRKDPYPIKKVQKLPPPRDPSLLFPKKNLMQKKKEPVRRVYSDEEDEYDSEMDDFIDDGDDEMDISSEIRNIFGYDKSKYRHVDEEDDRSMEASFAQLEREEKISAKIGMMEDLKDMEEEERHRKMKLKKKKMRS